MEWPRVATDPAGAGSAADRRGRGLLFRESGAGGGPLLHLAILGADAESTPIVQVRLGVDWLDGLPGPGGSRLAVSLPEVRRLQPMKVIIFEDSQARQWNGRAWMPIRADLAELRIDAGEAYFFTNRQQARIWRYIPPPLKPTRKQRRTCQHDWTWIGWLGYPRQMAAGWRYRCRKCGGYCR
jgi:hypothetical protein